MKKLITHAFATALALTLLAGCDVKVNIGDDGGKDAPAATVELTLEGLHKAVEKTKLYTTPVTEGGVTHASIGLSAPVAGFCVAAKKQTLDINVNEFETAEDAKAQADYYFAEMKKWDHNMFVPKTNGKFFVVFLGEDAKKAEKKVMAEFVKAGWVEENN